MADVAQTFALNPYAAEQAKNERLQRYAELLQSQGLAPNEKFSYGGIEAPPSAAGALAKGLQLGMSGYLQGRGIRSSEDLANKMTTERKASMDQVVAALQGTPGAAEVPGSVTATQADVNDREMGPAAASPIALGQQLATGGGMGEGANIGAPAKAAVPGSLDTAYATMMASKFPDLQAAGLSGMAARQAAKDARLLTLQDKADKFETDKQLKLAPEYRKPVPGVDLPLSPEVFGQNVAIAGAKANATAQPPAGYQVNPQGGLTPITGGPADSSASPKPRLPPGEVEKITAIDNSYGTQSKLMETYQDEFGGYGAAWAGDLKNFLAARTDSPEGQKQAQWWASHYANDSVTRNVLYGASLTPGETAAWERTTINPGMDAGMIRGRMKERADLIAAKRATTLENFSGAGYDVKDLKMRPSSYLFGEDRKAYDWAKAEIKKNPNNAAAKTLIEMYNK